jgi:hypothetical protein
MGISGSSSLNVLSGDSRRLAVVLSPPLIFLTRLSAFIFGADYTVSDGEQKQ